MKRKNKIIIMHAQYVVSIFISLWANESSSLNNTDNHINTMTSIQQNAPNSLPRSALLYLSFPQNKQFSTLGDFLEEMSTNAQFCVSTMHSIYDLANEHGLQNTGFSLETTKYSNDQGSEPFYIYLERPSVCIDNPSIHPLQTYQGLPEQGGFGRYVSLANANIQTDDKFFTYNKHAIRFKSFSRNLLIIPRGRYVSLYDFCKQGSQEEFMSLWKLAYQTYQEVKEGKLQLPHGKSSFRIAAHVGSNAAQTVPHFHLRLEVR